jgi:predicted Zn-dependent protease with MMP-like domain
MDHATFERIAWEAFDALPAHLRTAIHDVSIVIEDRPGPHHPRRGGLLLGLYEGIPLTAPDRNFSGKIPDKITLFREPIEEMAGSEEEIPHIIRETLWHEVAHFFGFGHRHIHAMEKRWRERRSEKGKKGQEGQKEEGTHQM